MLFLSRHFRKLNERYHGPEGDAFALEELLPVARRFVPDGGRALEVGCGYGRNLVALAASPAALAVGCDPALGELQRARERLAAPAPGRRARVALVRQEPFRLPFRDGAFDLVALWQVLEHVFGREAKRAVLAECARVLRPGGHLLVETPNQWFPFDYHDNKLPFVHWTGPRALREWLTFLVRGKRYHPSEYLSLPGCERLLRSAPGVRRVVRATRVYFAASYAEAWRGLGGTQVALKRVLFALLAPVHALLVPFGGSADYLLPSLRVVWRVEKDR
ncbi:MAG: class I SAM-dependent methyltransferase [Candidatus Eisenbacteria bacterium]|nr:class I SAM-dependent methyltransferase [Candidatus Eisenbacteria bacterium]